jgi:microcystin degradation protein MlrC
MEVKMRCAICGISHESNSFSTLKTGLQEFHVLRGQEILQDGYWGGFEDVEWVPTLVAGAMPHGLVDKDAYLSLKEELINRLSDSLPVDGVFMRLHGAMEVEDIGDGESDLLNSVREVVGTSVPIAGSLDLHGNIAPTFAEATNVLTALRTAPHVDGSETRARAVNHLIRCVKERIRPTNVLVKLPLLLPGEYAITGIKPARSLYEKLWEIESEPGIMDASILIGCAWTDSPFTSVSVIVVAEEDRQKAYEYAVSLARDIWTRREEFGPEVETATIEESIRGAMQMAERPVVISDSGDNVTAGGAGDIPIFLDRLLAAGATDAVVAGITDPDAVKACLQAGAGSDITLSVGGKLDRVNGYPLEVTGIVENLDPPSLAVLKTEGVRVILTSERRAFTSLRGFQQAGMDPLEQQIIVVKVGLLFSDIREIAQKTIMALSPGFTNLSLEQLPYKRIMRPIFPLDADAEWNIPDC